MEPGAIQDRVFGLPWQDIEADLNSRGYAVAPSLLAEDECVELSALSARDGLFRKTINMVRHGFGIGEYRYFAEPMPEPVAALRESLYAPLAQIANRWAERLRTGERFPETHAEYRRMCARGGQQQPTALMLDYESEGYNCLHQDVYGELAFPLQAAGLLSRPGVDFEGGEFLLVEQRLTVVHRDLIIVRMDFAEGQEAVAVAAEIDEGRLQGRFHPRDFRKIDIAFDLFFECGLDIVFVETVAGCDDNPDLFRVRAIHKHAL